MRMLLRGVCRLFSNLLPRPTHQELLDIEETEHWTSGKFTTCGGCIRLRRLSYFDDRHQDSINYCYLFDDRHCDPERFCLDCGVRDLPGDFRYQQGENWTDGRGRWSRCKNCHRIGRTLQDFISPGLCEPCCRVRIKEGRERGEILEPGKKWNAADESSKVDEVRPEAPYPPTLISLPTQLLQSVIFILESDSRLMLRGVCRLFGELMPKARTEMERRQSLIAIETEPWARHRFFACGGCKRLRHARHFSMSKNFRQSIYAYEWPMVPGGANADQRFCIECGARDDEYQYDETFTYQAGEEWFDEQGAHWVRCEKCLESSSPMKYLANKKLCEPCYLAGEDWLNEEIWSRRVKCKNCHEIALPQRYFVQAKLCAPCFRMKMKEWKRQVPLPMPDWREDPIMDVLSYDEAMEVKRQLRIRDLEYDGVPLFTTLAPEILLTIISHLESDSRLILRRVTRSFSSLISKPTFQELLNSDWEP